MLDATISKLGVYPLYALALLGLWAAFSVARYRGERRAALRQAKAIEDGDTEPVSLHPVIDAGKCIGCGACTAACPEGKILGLIGGKAQLVDPGACVGHGACKTSCPTGAIELVFGTSRRGVDIPLVTPNFESSTPGLFIAGELGGMGLIANAVEQGRQAMAAIAKLDGMGHPATYDVIVVGAGPAGISASLSAKELELRCLTLEQHAMGGTVRHYPRGKIVMTRPAKLALYGRVHLRRVKKERLLGLWEDVVRSTGLTIYGGIRVERIVRQPWGFDVVTTAGSYPTRAVLLATGRRGAPNRLGVPGEDAAKVVYRLEEPQQYHGRHVLVVGGGDSALEAAVTLARVAVASLTLVHRGALFERARAATRQKLEAVRTNRGLQVLMEAHVVSIEEGTVRLSVGGRPHILPNDAVIVCAGGRLPTELLEQAGVAVERKYGTA